MTYQECKRTLQSLKYLRLDYERCKANIKELENTSKVTASYKNEPMGKGEVSSQPESITLKIVEEIEKYNDTINRYLDLKKSIEDSIDLYIPEQKTRLALKYYYIDNKSLYVIKDKLRLRSDSQVYLHIKQGIEILCNNIKQFV